MARVVLGAGRGGIGEGLALRASASSSVCVSSFASAVTTSRCQRSFGRIRTMMSSVGTSRLTTTNFHEKNPWEDALVNAYPSIKQEVELLLKREQVSASSRRMRHYHRTMPHRGSCASHSRAVLHAHPPSFYMRSIARAGVSGRRQAARVEDNAHLLQGRLTGLPNRAVSSDHGRAEAVEACWRDGCLPKAVSWHRASKHVDPCSWVLACHLGITCPDGGEAGSPYISVAGERYHWQDGAAMLFDPSFKCVASPYPLPWPSRVSHDGRCQGLAVPVALSQCSPSAVWCRRVRRHETFNPTDQDRIILNIDVFHPELTDLECEAIKLTIELKKKLFGATEEEVHATRR